MSNRPLEDIANDIAVTSAALLALFAELKAVAKHSYAQCANCGTPFEVGRGVNTKRRKFCSDRCRVAASRKR